MAPQGKWKSGSGRCQVADGVQISEVMLFFALVSAGRAVDIFQASPVMLEDLWRFIQAHVQVE